MEVLQESVLARGSPELTFKAVLVNFRKLQATASDPPPSSRTAAAPQCSWVELLHAVAGLCSVALPDMEEAAIYSSLTRSGSKTIALLASPDEIKRRQSNVAASSKTSVGLAGDGMAPSQGEVSHCASSESGEIGALCDKPEPSFSEIFSDSDSSDPESGRGEDDEFSEGKRQFIVACHSRRAEQESQAGLEEMVAGCGCFLRLSDRPRTSGVQILLLVVRRRWRRAGLGSCLLQMLKDPAVVGCYDALLTFADHKAERFFAARGFSDDPILTAKYKEIVDHWDNSTLMTYIPPFSGAVAGSSGRMAALSLCEDSYKTWRESAIASYCEQLSLIQSLRHEVVLLHSKLEAREDEVKSLKQQLEQVQRERLVADMEFADYRRQTQRLLCGAVEERAQKWLESEQQSTN